MTVTLGPVPRYQYQGLSADTKPTSSIVGVNDLFFETDTGNFFIYNGVSWNGYSLGGGGSAGQIPMGFNVMSFGAKNDGTDVVATTDAIQAALDEAAAATHGSAFGGAIYFPPGAYRSGPVVQSNSNVEIFGAGRGLTKIDFVPSGNSNPSALVTAQPDPGSWLTIALTAGTALANYGGIRDIRIATDDLTFEKNAILNVETSQYNIHRVVIDKFWGNNSCGVRILGHEICGIRDYFISATIPVRIQRGFFPISSVYYNDHHQFINGYVRAPHGSDPATYYPTGLPNTNFLVDDGVYLSNLTIDRIAFVGGRNAFYWVNPSTSVSLNYKVSISNGRKEQSGGTNAPAVANIGFIFDFTTTPTVLNDLVIRNMYIAGTSTDNGIYARRVANLLLENVFCPAPSASGLYFADVGDVYTMKWINCQHASAGNPAGLNIGSNIGSMRKATFRQNCNLPNNAEWTFESAPRVTKTLASGVNSNFATVYGVSSDIGGLDFPVGVEVIYFTTTAGAATLTGLPILATSVPYMFGKRIRCMIANGGNSLTLPHNSGTETTATHRFETPGATDAVYLAGQSWFIEYDATLSRWVVI